MRLSAFAGPWSLEREIRNHLDHSDARFSGRADFGLGETLGQYEETGRLSLNGGHSLVATRSYVWSERDGRIEVHFDHGGFFHGFDRDDPTPLAEHPCGKDFYRVSYDFRAWPVWTAEWKVDGPAKDYLLISTYRRTGQTTAIGA